MTDELDEALGQLRREYLLEAPGRLAELRKDLAAFRSGEVDAADSLTRRFHRLSGSGGSYGFPQSVRSVSRPNIGSRRSGPPHSEHAARLEDAVNRLSAAFDAAAIEMGLPDAGPAMAEFGWRALAIGQGKAAGGDRDRAATERISGANRNRPGRAKETQLAERPDLVAIIAEPDTDSYATATAWSGAGAARPRAIVLVDKTDTTDRVRALAAGIDVVMPASRVGVELPKYAKTLARIGSPPPRVLLIEEDTEQAHIITSWLEQVNARVTHCRDGLTARETLIRETPDLVLMDTRLPGLDGLSLARLMRQDSRFGLTPIVFLTGRMGRYPDRGSSGWRRPFPHRTGR
jgi:DNA-binding response OmpR family regulator